MKKYICCLLLLLIFPAGGGAESLQDGFMGIAWGSPSGQTEGARSQNGDMLMIQQSGLQLGKFRLDMVQYFFYKNQFSQAVIIHRDIDELAAALSAAYGPPDVNGNPQEPGMKNWLVKTENNGLVTIGILPQRGAAVLAHSAYLMPMLRAISGR